MAQKTGLKKQTFTTCTLKDLCPEDKQKVAQLVKQVVELGKENQQLKAAAATAAAAAEDKLRQIQDCNKQAVKENCSLKNKLGQAITVLRMYHHKVQGLDGAVKAMQHSVPAAGAHANAEHEQGTQQHKEGEDGPAGAEQQAPGQGSLSKQPASPPDTAGSQQAPSGPAAAVTATADAPSTAVSSPAATGAQGRAPAPAEQLQQCLCSRLLCEGLASALLSPGGSLAVGLPAQQLQAWQLQDSGLFAEQQVVAPRTVLEFDASIGSRGAFVVQELPAQQQRLQLLPGSTAAASSASSGSPAAAAVPSQTSGLLLAPQQQDTAGPQAMPQQQQQQRQPARVSAGGAATAAAAAAASSALAAVKAAAAACAAPPWQPDLSSCRGGSPSQQQPGASGGSAHHAVRHSSASSTQQAAYQAADSPGASAGSTLTGQPAAGARAAVEEVPVVDMASAPVHVLVQNEKSASSLHQAHVRVTIAGAMAEGQPSPMPPPAAAAPGAQPAAWSSSGGAALQGPEPWQHPDAQSASWQQPQAGLARCEPGQGLQSQHAGVQQWIWQQQQQSQCVQPQGRDPAALVDQHSYIASSAGRRSDLQQQQQAAGWSRPDSVASRPQSGSTAGVRSGALQPQPVSVPLAAARPAQQHGHDRSQHGSWSVGGDPHWQQPHRQQLARQRQAQELAEQQAWHQQQAQQLSAPGQAPGTAASGVCDAGTRELLQRFDESLVDILAEVERLEQQQSLARQQLHQQQLHQQELHQQPQRPAQDHKPQAAAPQQRQHMAHQRDLAPAPDQRSGVPAAAGAAAAGSLAAAAAGGGWQQTVLDQKQAQLQRRLLQLQQEEEGMRLGVNRGAYGAAAPPRHQLHGQLNGPPSVQGWGHSDAYAYDADDVSDILNHLD